jgi:hypothetical protein
MQPSSTNLVSAEFTKTNLLPTAGPEADFHSHSSLISTTTIAHRYRRLGLFPRQMEAAADSIDDTRLSSAAKAWHNTSASTDLPSPTRLALVPAITRSSLESHRSETSTTVPESISFIDLPLTPSPTPPATNSPYTRPKPCINPFRKGSLQDRDTNACLGGTPSESPAEAIPPANMFDGVDADPSTTTTKFAFTTTSQPVTDVSVATRSQWDTTMPTGWVQTSGGSHGSTTALGKQNFLFTTYPNATTAGSVFRAMCTSATIRPITQTSLLSSTAFEIEPTWAV